MKYLSAVEVTCSSSDFVRDLEVRQSSDFERYVASKHGRAVISSAQWLPNSASAVFAKVRVQLSGKPLQVC